MMKCIFLSICLWRNNLNLLIITDDHNGDNEDNDDDDDDNEVSLGIFVAVRILLEFVSSLLVLPEFCLTPPHPNPSPTPPVFIRVAPVFNSDV